MFFKALLSWYVLREKCLVPPNTVGMMFASTELSWNFALIFLLALSFSALHYGCFLDMTYVLDKSSSSLSELNFTFFILSNMVYSLEMLSKNLLTEWIKESIEKRIFSFWKHT